MEDSEGAPKDYAGFVTVDHRPANEIWMGLISERVGDYTDGNGEGGGVSGVLKRVELVPRISP